MTQVQVPEQHPHPAPLLGTAHLSDLLEAAPDATVLVGTDGKIVHANSQTAGLFGYGPAELVGLPVEALLPSSLRELHRRHRERYTTRPQTRPMGVGLDLTAARRDGSEFPVEISLATLATTQGPLVVAAVRDVTARHEAQQALRDSEERFRLTFEASPLGIAILALDGQTLRVNQALCDLLAFPQAELLTMTLADLAGAPDAVRPDDAPIRRERCLRTGTGDRVWVELTVSLVRSSMGAPLHFVAQLRDVTEPRRHADELQRMAMTDALTGLPNRALLLDRAARLLSRPDRQPGSVTLQLLDLDHFKHVNDTLGHQAGDALLREVARRLTCLSRASDTVARLGGDEFALLSGDLEPGQAYALAERVRQVLAEPVELISCLGKPESVRVTASIGIAEGAPQTTTPHDLYREADLALYEAKGKGRDRCAVYDASLSRSLEQRRANDAQLRTALEHDGLVVQYQRIEDLRTGELRGYEALVRLRAPGSTTLVPPTQFLPLAEELHLLPRIDLAVLSSSLHRLELLDDRVQVHVNVTAATLEDVTWTEALLAAAARGSVAQRICVELTEHSLMSTSGVAAGHLSELRAAGICVGLDDFGTGYSSLSYLQNLPVDFLKLDVSLVEDVAVDPRAATMVQAIISLAHSLGLEVVAEGIADERQRELLTRWGCDLGQGFLLGGPDDL